MPKDIDKIEVDNAIVEKINEILPKFEDQSPLEDTEIDQGRKEIACYLIAYEI